jgi:hypothetical protein
LFTFLQRENFRVTELCNVFLRGLNVNEVVYSFFFFKSVKFYLKNTLYKISTPVSWRPGLHALFPDYLN